MEGQVSVFVTYVQVSIPFAPFSVGVGEADAVFIAGRKPAETAINYDSVIPEGFDIIKLPAAKYLMFQGEPFKEEDYCNAIETVQNSMKKYDPSTIGYVWDDSNPRIQLEPRGERGYIELKAIRSL